MKKFAVLLTAAVMAGSVSVFGEESIKVVVDGKPVVFEGQQPLVKDSRTLVPLRGIFEALGAQVEWTAETQTITSTKQDDKVVMQIGSKELVKNDAKQEMDVAPELIEGSTMVPARAVAESFGADVQWDEATKTVTITNAVAEAPATTPETPETPAAPAEDVTPAQPTIPSVKGDNTITEKTVEDSVKAEDKAVVLTAKAVYPEIANSKNSSGISAVNKALKAQAEEMVKAFVKEGSKDAQSIYAEKKGENFIPYEATLSYGITHDKDDVISIVFTNSQNTGGAHPNTVLSSITYDLKTGKEMKITDVSSKTQDEIDKLVMDEFTKLIDEKPENFLKDAKASLKNSIKNIGFYVTENGSVCFYANPYEIAPYSSGVISVTLDLSK